MEDIGSLVGRHQFSVPVPAEEQGQVYGNVIPDEHSILETEKFVDRCLAGAKVMRADCGIFFQGPFQQIQKVGRHKGPGTQLEGCEWSAIRVVVAVLADVGAVYLFEGRHFPGAVQHPGAILVEGVGRLGRNLDELGSRQAVNVGYGQGAVLVAANELDVAGHPVLGIEGVNLDEGPPHSWVGGGLGMAVMQVVPGSCCCRCVDGSPPSTETITK